MKWRGEKITPNENLSLEERRRRLIWRIENEPLRPAKPKPTPVVTVPVSDKIAEAVKANPESVRLSARGADGVSVFGGPQRNSANVTVMVEQVREVDAEGRPVWPKVGATHEYDPFSRL